MGKRGQQRTPTATLKLRGSRLVRERTAEPQSTGEPTPPEWLDGVALEKWMELIPQLREMGVLGSVDADALVAYCSAWADFCAARDHVAEHGHITTSVKGGLYQHPLVSIGNKAVERMNRIGSQFGWTPSARAGLSAKPQQKGKLAEFLSG